MFTHFWWLFRKKCVFAKASALVRGPRSWSSANLVIFRPQHCYNSRLYCWNRDWLGFRQDRLDSGRTTWFRQDRLGSGRTGLIQAGQAWFRQNNLIQAGQTWFKQDSLVQAGQAWFRQDRLDSGRTGLIQAGQAWFRQDRLDSGRTGLIQAGQAWFRQGVFDLWQKGRCLFQADLEKDLTSSWRLCWSRQLSRTSDQGQSHICKWRIGEKNSVNWQNTLW